MLYYTILLLLGGTDRGLGAKYIMKNPIIIMLKFIMMFFCSELYFRFTQEDKKNINDSHIPHFTFRINDTIPNIIDRN